ncbi:Right handed beta helix region-containing protein [Desulfonema limicola]|uniref:Right handed beta helix region-containing protein n=1 Tax=Desulfonema limicola TaxID=45656 RepID=A0A975BDH9_9BACT|nr:right-handed parallel beta-helix repeat-containing protein [Desulfonema limicola]QTA83512.1 Right handed beta helix region-containing protein [Desulfonema limicola]
MQRQKYLFGKIFCISIILIFLVSEGICFVKGDFNGDDKIDLSESINALQVVAGLRSSNVVKTINVPTDFSTITEAVEAANEGDTIVVAAGTYNETILISKNNISLQGSGKDTTFINGAGQNVITINGSKGVTITEFTVQNGTIGVYARQGAVIELSNIIIQDNSSAGIRIDENTRAGISNCSVLRNGDDGIRILRNSTATFSGIISSSNNTNEGIDLNLTSSSIFYNATVTASSNTGKGINVHNSSSLISLESTIKSQNNTSDGIGVGGVSTFVLDSNSNLLTEKNNKRGISVARTSSIYRAYA